MMDLAKWWHWENDAPNWFAIVFSVFVWPSLVSAVGYWFYKRKVQNIPHLEVLRTPIQTVIGSATGTQIYPTVGLTFTNRTASVVYISRPRLLERRSSFPTPAAAVRDLSGWCELKFQAPNGRHIDHEQVLQTDGSAITSIATTQPMPNEFYSYRPGRVRKLLRRPKYFTLEYAAMVGERKYSVATTF
jgi:hypothetical protein